MHFSHSNGANKEVEHKKSITVGMDLGDKKHRLCVLNHQGEVIEKNEVNNTAKAIRKKFEKMEPCLVAVEAGTHSPWISRILEELGHRVLVGNPRKLRVIWDSDDKSDDRDSEMLARIARFDPHLLYPIRHRGKEAQADLAVIKARGALIKSLTYGVRDPEHFFLCSLMTCTFSL